MMGVELPAQDRESNINLGDRDSVRRRALWALEGKSGADSFAPVEIPVLNTPELERRLFELREYFHLLLRSRQCSGNDCKRGAADDGNSMLAISMMGRRPSSMSSFVEWSLRSSPAALVVCRLPVR